VSGQDHNPCTDAPHPVGASPAADNRDGLSTGHLPSALRGSRLEYADTGRLWSDLGSSGVGFM